MQFVTIANTTLIVSPLCLGTNQFGTGLDDVRAADILDSFFDLGGNFIDTAHAYGDWIPDAPRSASERCLGRLLQRRPRDSYVLATKGCEFDYRAGFDLRVNPALLAQDLAGSLEALATDYIDLYWLHRDDPGQPAAGLLDALIEHQQAGRIRYFGCSNWSPARIAEAQAHAARIGHTGFVAVQPMWGLADPDRDALQRYAPGGYYEDGYRALHADGLTMIPYSGQSRGFFSKLATGAPVPDDIAVLFQSERNQRKLPVIMEIAERHGAGINEVVLAYLLSQPMPTVPIIGCSRPEQLSESVQACAVRLDANELAALRNA
jgi:aryl-alcohol dehydrogenase-like predicted oxidoreductase